MYRTKPRSREMAEEERLKDLTVPEEAGKYLRARGVLAALRERYRKGIITQQEMKTLRGQALNGDIDGAVKGLAKIEARKREEAEK